MFISEVFDDFSLKTGNFRTDSASFHQPLHCPPFWLPKEWSGTQCSLIGQQSCAYAYAYAKPVLTGNNSDISISISIRTQGFDILILMPMPMLMSWPSSQALKLLMLVLMLMSRPSSQAHKLLMLVLMLMLASLVRTGLKFRKGGLQN